ncbi:hypothetical protein AtNW77_Chr2g0231211 [Arabidopsis thaliana]
MSLSSSSLSLNNLTVTINKTIFDYQPPLRFLRNFQFHLLLSHLPHDHHHRILFQHNLHQICNLCYISRNHHRVLHFRHHLRLHYPPPLRYPPPTPSRAPPPS